MISAIRFVMSKIFAFGNAKRLPAAPPQRIIAPALIPIPRHTVETSDCTYCIAS